MASRTRNPHAKVAIGTVRVAGRDVPVHVDKEFQRFFDTLGGLGDAVDGGKGGGLVGFDPTLNYPMNTVGRAMADDEWNVLWFPDVREAVAAGTDCTSAVDAVMALKVASGGGSLFFPRAPSGGAWFYSGGEASPDGYKNGILVPFNSVNPDPTGAIKLRGERGTRFLAGADNIVLVRISRNCTTMQDIVLDANGKTGVILCGVVPEDMTQTTTLVSQSQVDILNVDRVGGAGVDGIVIQPGPQVSGADSGCFYHNIIGGVSNFIGGGRHVYLKKNVDWGTYPNRPTRTNFIGQRVTRGNVGYHIEVGSEILLEGCYEESISSGVTPIGTPVARYVSADATNIVFVGGYSEACTASFTGFANNVTSYSYIPASGSDTDFTTYVASFNDAVNDSRSWTPVLASSGGGSEGASTSTGQASKQGKLVHFTCQVSAAKGTLGAGTLTVSGLPYVADSSWAGAGLQGVAVVNWSGITFTANVYTMAAYVSGATIVIRKLHAAGAGPAGLTLAECADPVIFTIQGTYKAV